MLILIAALIKVTIYLTKIKKTNFKIHIEDKIMIEMMKNYFKVKGKILGN